MYLPVITFMFNPLKRRLVHVPIILNLRKTLNALIETGRKVLKSSNLAYTTVSVRDKSRKNVFYVLSWQDTVAKCTTAIFVCTVDCPNTFAYLLQTFIQFQLDFSSNSSICRLSKDPRDVGAIPEKIQQQLLDSFGYTLFLRTQLAQRYSKKPGTERTLGVSKYEQMNPFRSTLKRRCFTTSDLKIVKQIIYVRLRVLLYFNCSNVSDTCCKVPVISIIIYHLHETTAKFYNEYN